MLSARAVAAALGGRRRTTSPRYQRPASTAYSVTCASFRIAKWPASSSDGVAAGQIQRRAGSRNPPVCSALPVSVDSAMITAIQAIGGTQSARRILASLYRGRGRVAPDARRDPRRSLYVTVDR